MHKPRLFGVPLGVPYAPAFVTGFLNRFGDLPPEAMARITVYANTGRMARAISAAFQDRGHRLLPKLLTLADLGDHPAALPLPPAAEPVALELELAQLTRALLENDPTIAPPSSAFDIAGSLLQLMGEMGGEGVSPKHLDALDLSGQSAHWARSLAFIEIVSDFLDRENGALQPEVRARAASEAVVAAWQADPPKHPIVIAGSTASRGATRLIVEAAARGSFGFVVLPGIDRAMPNEVWSELGEAHPQYRFAALLKNLDLQPDDILPWGDETATAARARVLSLALRPPPVTDQWLGEGSELPFLPGALNAVTLLEAPNARSEAVSIALGLRDAVERGKRAALVTPDRTLTRRVAAALARWGIEPDDSAGRPLLLSPPGRLLRQVSGIMASGPDGDSVLALLKHPLVAAGSGRGPHLLHTREFELWLRRGGRAMTGTSTLSTFAQDDPGRLAWVGWLAPKLEALPLGQGALSAAIETCIARTESLVGGPQNGVSDELWAMEAGESTREAINALRRAAPAVGPVSPQDFKRILDRALTGEVRDAILPHGDVMIRGTLEVRALDADVVLLAGLNEGIWPPAPDPDPWLNRALRKQAGLLAPERRTGLSAHDFEIGFNAPEIWLCRTLRTDEGETVPSRWLNRITGLVGGLEERSGPAALEEMRARGAHWLQIAEGLDRRAAPEDPAPRPAPCPPIAVRPHQMSVTEVQTLVRDPYAVYAKRVLGLRALPAPPRSADPRLRGEVLHEVAERFVREGLTHDADRDRLRLLEVASNTFDQRVPWAVTRVLWLSRLERVAPAFLAGEYARQVIGDPIAFEAKGAYELLLREAALPFRLVGKADRIDLRPAGLAILDYKSGRVPTEREVRHFDRQLLLEAVMAEAGAFEGIRAGPVVEVAHIGLGANPEVRTYPLDGSGPDGFETETVLAEFVSLLSAYSDVDQGYTSRRAMASVGYDGDYDHLARYGEWDDTFVPEAFKVP